MAGLEPEHRYRISDGERDEALHGLRTALEEGRLSLDEHEARSENALHAVTNTDLVPLFDDLPPGLQPASLTTPTPLRETAPAERDETVSTETEKDEEPEKPEKDEEKAGSGVNVGALGGFGGFLLLVWGLPVFINGSFVPIAIFLGFFCFLVVGPLAGQLVHNRNQRLKGGKDGPGQIEGY